MNYSAKTVSILTQITGVFCEYGMCCDRQQFYCGKLHAEELVQEVSQNI
jgi:hypothetical protein